MGGRHEAYESSCTGRSDRVRRDGNRMWLIGLDSQQLDDYGCRDDGVDFKRGIDVQLVDGGQGRSGRDHGARYHAGAGGARAGGLQAGSEDEQPDLPAAAERSRHCEKGAQADLDGVELEKAQQSKTPYYVKLRVTNVGSGNASAEEGVPAAAFQAIDDRGQQGQELTVLGHLPAVRIRAGQPRRSSPGGCHVSDVRGVHGRGRRLDRQGRVDGQRRRVHRKADRMERG